MSDDVIAKFRAKCDEEASRMALASTVDGIAKLAGVPRWKVFKVVSLELEQKVTAVLGKPRDADLMSVVTESIAYARELTREDGYKAVWVSRRLRDLRAFLKDYGT